MICNQENLASLDKAIAQNPDDIKALAHRSEIERLGRHYKKALADLNRIIQLKPDHAWAIAHRGAVYFRIKQDDEALMDLNRAIELKSDYAWALIYRANLYTMKRCYEEALLDVDKAFAINKTIIPHRQGERGLLLSYLRRYSQAIECCEQGLKDDPNDYVALYTRLVVKVRQFGIDKVDKADFEKTRTAVQAMVNTEERAGALYRLGGLVALEAQREQALDYLQQAISLDEHEPRGLAHHDLAWLEMHDEPRFQSLIGEEN